MRHDRSRLLVCLFALAVPACGHPKVPDEQVHADFRALGVEGAAFSPMNIPFTAAITGQTVDGDFATVNFTATYDGYVVRHRPGGPTSVHESGDHACAYRYQWQAGWRYVEFSGHCN